MSWQSGYPYPPPEKAGSVSALLLELIDDHVDLGRALWRDRFYDLVRKIEEMEKEVCDEPDHHP